MAKVPSGGVIEHVEYVIVLIGVLNVLIAYIFTNFKKNIEKRIEILEIKTDKDHDKINKLVTLEEERKNGS